METTMSSGSQTAVRNSSKATAAKAKFLLVWLAVSIPMLWGIAKALDDVRNLFP
jgi:hypothetical protein